jgi:CRISPR-associated endonuclease/helicase Cas3
LAHSGGNAQALRRQPSFTAWGKLSRDGLGQLLDEHPLLDHMTDVAACFLALAECTAIRRSLEKTAGRALDSSDLQRLAVLVFLHDVGKANVGFQSRRWQSPDRPPGNWPTMPFGHGPEGWELISGRVLNAEHYAVGLPIAEIVAWGEVAVCELLQASISHHGRPLGVSPGKESEGIWKPVLDKAGVVLYDPAATLASMGERVKQSYPLAFSECHQPLPDLPAFVQLFEAGQVDSLYFALPTRVAATQLYVAGDRGSPARAG